MSCSTAPISGVSRSRKLAHRAEHATRTVRRLAPAQRGAHPGLPVGAARHPRPRPDPDDGRLHRLPHVDVGVPGDEHVRARRRPPRPGSPSTPRRGGRPAPRAGAPARARTPRRRRRGRPSRASARRRCPRRAGRGPTPAPPARRRAGPPPRSARPAPCARCGPATCTDPDAERAGPAGAPAGRTSVATAPSNRNAAGAQREHPPPPLRSSSVTSRALAATTAPQKPLAGSSTTRPASAATSGIASRTWRRVPSARNRPR